MSSIGRRTAMLGALTTPFATRAWAVDYPTRPIKLVVPYAPGGGADAVARIIAKLAGDSMGQSIVIENKGGAGSIVGTDLVAKSAPDGYTLLLGQSGPISINPAVYKHLPYDPVKELTPVTMTNSYPYVLINSKTPAKDLEAFVALAKEKAVWNRRSRAVHALHRAATSALYRAPRRHLADISGHRDCGRCDPTRSARRHGRGRALHDCRTGRTCWERRHGHGRPTRRCWPDGCHDDRRHWAPAPR
jgi:hypothetical protein